MTDQEIIKNRQVEILKQHGYVDDGIGRFKKVIGNFIHLAFIDNIISDTRMNLFCTHTNIHCGYDTGFIKLDYEELSLLIDIFNKNYN